MLCQANKNYFTKFLESEMIDHLANVYGKDVSLIHKTADFVSKSVDMGYAQILMDMDKKRNRPEFDEIMEAIYSDEEHWDPGHEAYHTSKDNKQYARMREPTNTNLYSLHDLPEGHV